MALASTTITEALRCDEPSPPPPEENAVPVSSISTSGCMMLGTPDLNKSDICQDMSVMLTPRRSRGYESGNNQRIITPLPSRGLQDLTSLTLRTGQDIATNLDGKSQPHEHCKHMMTCHLESPF